MFQQLEMFEQEYDSREEILFSYYVTELLEHGWLEHAEYQPASFVLSEDHLVHAYEQKKDKNVPVNVKLARGHKYTADWKLAWSKKADGVFFWHTGGVYKSGFYPYRKARAGNHVPFYATSRQTYVDIKGGFIGRNNTSAITFPINQKMLLTEGVFVQKVVVSLDQKSIFHKTFTPRRVVYEEIYKVDGKHGKKGHTKLKYEPKLLEQWLRS